MIYVYSVSIIIKMALQKKIKEGERNVWLFQMIKLLGT